MIKTARAAVSAKVVHLSDPVTDAPTPFVKWLGGKRLIAGRILAHRPERISRYVEPFVGGGAVFFALRRSGFDGPALLCDTNVELIETYRVVRDHPRALVIALRKHVNEEAYYYEVRAQDTSTLTQVQRAARFIFLNRTCFNGLWRENKSGGMNSPFGRYPNPTICDEPKIMAASHALRFTTIERCSFRSLADVVGRGDFIYCDPPYLPVSETASFTTYSAGGFGIEDHRELARLALLWAAHGARVVLSNADVPMAHIVYTDEFQRERIEVARAVNSRGDRRGKVGELVLRTGL